MRIKHWLLTAVLLLCSITANAYDFKVDGIYYNITSPECMAVEVTNSGSNGSYDGDVSIPSTVTFEGQEYSVISIGSAAFSGCYSLTSITIPEGVTSIGNRTFYRCSSLTSIILPESVASIGSWAFDDCSSLTAITIPESVTSIGEYAFLDCSSLTSIAIPKSVTSIGSTALSGCSSLTSFVVKEGNAVYDSRDNCNAIIETSTNTLIAGCASTVIPESVTSIGGYAFSGCSSLISITIPKGVTSIGNYAFRGCSSLPSITIPESVTSIGSNVFSGCSSLTSITIPEGVTEIGNTAFSGCSSLPSITIPESVTSIGSNAFSGCSSLAAITLPGGVTSIGSYAFYNCSNLTSITLPESVTSIGSNAFSGCSSLPSITIPESVTSIGSSAFYNCSSLTNLYLSSIESWLNITFGDNTSHPNYYAKNIYLNGELVTEVVLPEAITSIPEYAFRNFTHLTSITIPESVTSIGSNAFSGCSSLAAITLPGGVTSIGSYAFYNCSNLTSITLPESVTSIGSNAFSGCSSLISIICYSETPPDVSGKLSVPSNCSLYVFSPFIDLYKRNWRWNVFKSIKSITANVTYLIDGDVYLTQETACGDTLTLIDGPIKEGYTFSGWSEAPVIMPVADITIIGSYVLNATQTDEQGLIYTLNETDDAFEVSGLEELLVGDLVIPSELYGLPIISVKKKVLMGAEDLKSIVIPSSITAVGERLFYGCSNLLVVEWNTTAPVRAECFDEPSRHNNLLVFVTDASTPVTYEGNVVVDGAAEDIQLTGGFPLRIPRAFTAHSVTCTHEFTKRTKIGQAGGWEALVLPFDVQTIVSEKKGTLLPFGQADFSTSLPYWAAEMQTDGTFAIVDDIKANTPFIMEVPNGDEYEDRYNIEGTVTFSATDVMVHATTENLQPSANGYSMRVAYEGVEAASGVYALNDEEYVADGNTFLPGGVFVADSRDIRPFEAYIYSNSASRAPYLRIGGKEGTGIDCIVSAEGGDAWYTLQGVRLNGKPQERGTYIHNGRKVIVW